MTSFSPSTETAREDARLPSGEFGAQIHTVPEVRLLTVDEARLAKRAREAEEAEQSRRRIGRLIAEGAYSTAAENSFLDEWEDERSIDTPQEAVDALLEARRPEDPKYEREFRLATAELSRRAARGIDGTLVDAGRLRVGDRVYVGHLAEGFYVPNDDGYATLTWRPDSFSGEVALGFGQDRMNVPVGTRLPVDCYAIGGGEPRTPSETVELLIRRGDLPRESRTIPAVDAIRTYNTNQGLTESDPGYIQAVPVTAKENMR